MASEEKIFEYFFQIKCFPIAVATNQNQQFEHNSYVK